MMSTQPSNYESVLADLEAKRAQIDQAIAALKAVMSAASGGGEFSGISGGSVSPNAFLGLSIPDAVKKYLTIVRQKKSTQELMKALEAGGMPEIAYATIYAVLRRRQKAFGDIVNMKGDWGLAEWYPNFKFKSGKPEPTGVPVDEAEEPEEPEEAKKGEGQ